MKDRYAAAQNAYGAGMAKAYGALMPGDFSYAGYADYIEALFKEHGVRGGSLVADLGCGTGNLCLELAARGYDMIGIDGSPEMLTVALDGISGAEAGHRALFLCQQLHDFELYGTVAAVLSTIDTLNYITDSRRLARVFRLVGNYLDPGGLFIFDLNTPYRLSRVFGNNHFYYVSDDLCYLWNCGYARGRATFDLTLFTRGDGGLWTREDEIHRQRAYTYEEILGFALCAALEPVGAYGFLGFDPPKRNAEKISCVFKKTAAD